MTGAAKHAFDRDGWAVYSTKPDPDEWFSKMLAAASTLEADCREFVSAAQDGKTKKLWQHFAPSWDAFVRDCLGLDADYAELVILGAVQLRPAEFTYGWPCSLALPAHEAALAASIEDGQV